MAKTWQEKFEQKRTEKIKTLEIDFADIHAGETMLISTPEKIAAYINQIPAEQNLDLLQMRKDLAHNAQADKTCPVTSAIYLRIIAERSLELMAQSLDPIAPFWKVIDPDSPLASKLSCGKEFVAKMRSTNK